jgi:hypothetical protein
MRLESFKATKQVVSPASSQHRIFQWNSHFHVGIIGTTHVGDSADDVDIPCHGIAQSMRSRVIMQKLLQDFLELPAISTITVPVGKTLHAATSQKRFGKGISFEDEATVVVHLVAAVTTDVAQRKVGKTATNAEDKCTVTACAGRSDALGSQNDGIARSISHCSAHTINSHYRSGLAIYNKRSWNAESMSKNTDQKNYVSQKFGEETTKKNFVTKVYGLGIFTKSVSKLQTKKSSDKHFKVNKKKH